jgi:glycosyltransferase involved in cell wall biosynthesis
MNVVHVFPYSAKVPGGHSNAIRSFIACQRVAGLNAVGIATEAEARLAKLTCEFPYAEVGSLWDLRWATLAERFKLRAEATLLNLHSVNRRFAPLLEDLRRAGIPYVLTSHGQLSFQTPWRWLKKIIYLNLVNRGPLRAAGLHALTKFAAQRAKYLLPTFHGDVLVQGNLVDLRNLGGSTIASRSDYGIPNDACVLGFLGRLDVHVKGLDLLVEAFSCLPSDRFRLLLIGPDWNGGKAELELQAERFGCKDRIHFTGAIYGDKKWSLLRMADVFVSPSRWEAFSIAQAEAMAIGLPVVTSTGVNLALDLREADAALLTPLAVEPLAKAIATLEADGVGRQALANRGQAWVRKYCDPDHAGPRFQQFYQAILEKNRAIAKGKKAA